MITMKNTLLLTLIILTVSCTNACNKNSNEKEKIIADGSVSIQQQKQSADTIINRFGITMDKFIGIDGFHEDRIEWMQPVGFLRAYCNWDWFQGDLPENPMEYQVSRSGWFFDEAFKNITDAGFTIDLCLQNAISHLQGPAIDFKPDDRPIDKPGLSTTAASSYTKIANAFYQIAARYGATKVPVEKLHLSEGQPVLSGLGYIPYLEVWNEPNKNWMGPDAEFSPEEYAAMLSICYDKIKEADPKMKVVMGGLAGIHIDYIKRMKAWFEANRTDKKFAADVVNMHEYAFNNKINWESGNAFGPAETPEDGNLYGKAKELVDYCHANIPNTEVWISEFGWDTNKESVLCPKPIEGLTINELQARYIVRGYLAFAAAGIDRAQLFSLLDPSQNYISTQYGTSGILDRTKNAERKISWYYVQTLKTSLMNMVYIGSVPTSQPGVMIYKFKNISGDDGAYVVWSATSSNVINNNFTLKLNLKANKAEKIELAEKINGNRSNINITNNSVQFQLSEKPIFITVNNIN